MRKMAYALVEFGGSTCHDECLNRFPIQEVRRPRSLILNVKMLDLIVRIGFQGLSALKCPVKR